MNDSFSNLVNSKTPVLIDFSAEWCGPCKMLRPVLEQLKTSMGDSIRIIKIDVDNNRDLALKYNIRSVPTLMLFREGSLLWSGSGIKTSDYLENIINSHCSITSK